MKSIQAQEKSVKGLFTSQYSVDSYQREYKWEEKQVDDLLDDLGEAFDENYNDTHEQKDVKGYDQYFLGAVLVGEGDGTSKDFIIDGQQRLTTLTLMLICLRSQLYRNKDEKDQDTKKITKVGNLIRSDEYGTDSFILDVSERAKCLEALYEGDAFDASKENESVRNLIARYKQIQGRLEDLPDAQIPFFIEWLIEKVHLVVITAASSKDKPDRVIFADRIFQTMNDRGLNLTPTEMLKGYLLSQITEDSRRDRVNEEWKKQIERLNSMDKATDAEAIKSWLRGRHAKSSHDFEEIGSRFHRWVRDNKTQLGLKKSSAFESFIETDFNFYAKRFRELRQAANKFNARSRLECVYYLAQHGFTLQYPILLASLSPGDSDTEIKQKLGVVTAYLDILIHQRIGHRAAIAERTMRSLIFSLIPRIRNKSATQIAQFLTKRLEEDGYKSTLEQNFAWHGNYRNKIHRILARITDYIGRESGISPHYSDYFQDFQIEHIWRGNFDADRQKDFSHEYDFWEARGKIGGLVLLPYKDNASYGDLPYEEKREHYIKHLKQNLLAASLHEKCYARNPGFKQFIQRTGLPFTAHRKFNLSTLTKRQELYREIADQIWNKDRLHKEAQRV